MLYSYLYPQNEINNDSSIRVSDCSTGISLYVIGQKVEGWGWGKPPTYYPTSRISTACTHKTKSKYKETPNGFYKSLQR